MKKFLKNLSLEVDFKPPHMDEINSHNIYEKLGRNPNWRVIMTNYELCTYYTPIPTFMYIFKVYSLRQKSESERVHGAFVEKNFSLGDYKLCFICMDSSHSSVYKSESNQLYVRFVEIFIIKFKIII